MGRGFAIGVSLLLLTSCGRIGFERVGGGVDASDSQSAVDAPGASDAASGNYALVQGTGIMNAATSSMVTISSTVAGDLLVLGVTQESNTTATVATIGDDAGNSYVTANQRSIDTSCNNTAEIWYASNVHAGATKVTVMMSANVTVEVWVAEFSGLAAVNPVDTGAVASTQPSGSMIAAPAVTPSAPDALVISTAATCGGIGGIHAGSPFTALSILNGENTAYYIAHAAGSYGAVWSYGGGSWNASTVAFR